MIIQILNLSAQGRSVKRGISRLQWFIAQLRGERIEHDEILELVNITT